MMPASLPTSGFTYLSHKGRGAHLPLPRQINLISSRLMPHARRSRMSGHLEALAGIGDLGAADFQDREILVDVVSGQQVFAVGREYERLRQAADLDIPDLGHLLAVDLQDREAAVFVVVER